jgi:hypothetical protein
MNDDEHEGWSFKWHLLGYRLLPYAAVAAVALWSTVLIVRAAD